MRGGVGGGGEGGGRCGRQVGGEVLRDEALHVGLVGEQVGRDEGPEGEGAERGDAAAELDDGGARAEEREDGVVVAAREPRCE